MALVFRVKSMPFGLLKLLPKTMLLPPASRIPFLTDRFERLPSICPLNDRGPSNFRSGGIEDFNE